MRWTALRSLAMSWSRTESPSSGGTPGGSAPELVPDAILYDDAGPTSGSRAVSDLPHDDEGRIGTDLANLSWRSRMRWLDDGGR